MIVLLYHAAFEANYSFSPKFSLRNLYRIKGAFSPLQKPLAPAPHHTAEPRRPKKFTISSLFHLAQPSRQFWA